MGRQSQMKRIRRAAKYAVAANLMPSPENLVKAFQMERHFRGKHMDAIYSSVYEEIAKRIGQMEVVQVDPATPENIPDDLT